MFTWLRKLKADRRGATAIEYGLIASLISLALFAGLQKYYTALDGTYSTIISNVQSAQQ